MDYPTSNLSESELLKGIDRSDMDAVVLLQKESWQALSQMNYPWIYDDAFYPSVITYSIAFLVGVTGNSLVVFATLGDKKSRSVTTSFLVSLALADLLFLLICVPYVMLDTFTGHWTGGLITCKLSAFIEALTGMASVLNLTSVSVERYIVIVHPMKSRSWCTLGKTARILVFVWIAAVLVASPTIYIMDTENFLYYTVHNSTDPMPNVDTKTIVVCSEGNLHSVAEKGAFAVYMFLIMFAIPTLLMTFCYARVIWVLWLSTQELARMTSASATRNCHRTSAHDESRQRLTASSYSPVRDGHSDRNPLNNAAQNHSAEICQARKQVIKMLVTIITIFLLAWGPKLVLNVMIKHEVQYLQSNFGFYIKLCVSLLPYIQSAVNPIIYGFMSKNFRRSMRTACRIYLCKFCVTRCRRKDHCADFDMESRTMNGTTTHSVITTNVSPSLSGRAGRRKEITLDTEI